MFLLHASRYLTVTCGILWRLGVVVVDGKHVSGHLVTPYKWQFLARFCFLSDDGELKYDLEYPKEFEVQRIGLYFDREDQWPAVYNTGKTCEEKRSVLNADNGQFINLTVLEYESNCEERNRSLSSPGAHRVYIRCTGHRRFRSVRERWWFLAVFNCHSAAGINLRYNLLMTNGGPGDLFSRHFSADEFYILEVDIAYTVLYFFLFNLTIAVAVRLRSRQLFHVTYKLYMFSVILQFFSLILLDIAYARYAIDGVGLPGCKNFGRLLAASQSLLFQLLLVLLAKGYTVTRGRLRQITSVKITLFFTCYVVVYATLFIYDAEFMDPGEVLYIYESPAGVGLVIMRVIGWLWFVYAIIFTLKNYPEKSQFYYWFFFFYTLWFLVTPVLIIVATYKIDKWAREKIVNGTEINIAFVGHVIFLVLTRPTASNDNFPYHVRTNQISAMSEDELDKEGSRSAAAGANFTEYAYAPGSNYVGNTTMTRDEITDIFTVPVRNNNTQIARRSVSVDTGRGSSTVSGGNPEVASELMSMFMTSRTRSVDTGAAGNNQPPPSYNEVIQSS